MRVLALTTIFPNGLYPQYAPYTLQQAQHLARRVDLSVWATVPWFPGERTVRGMLGEQRDIRRLPAQEQVHGMSVEHPRFLRIPRVGLPVAAGAYAASILSRLRRAPLPDVLFATWAYPDGAAAVLLGMALGIPAVVQVIGSDIHQIAHVPSVKVQLRRLLPRAGGVVAVSEPLAVASRDLGAPADRTHVIPTGIDLSRFRPSSRREALAALDLPANARVIVFVGRLVPPKGLRELFDAFSRIADADPRLRLTIVGDGPHRQEFAQRAAALGPRVRMAGEADHDGVARWIAASWLVSLPSYTEGTPNVVIEALCSGRPVVATHVGGIPAMVQHPTQGRLVAPRDAAALAEALLDVASREHDPESIVAASPFFDWAENAARVHRVLTEAVDRPRE